MFTIFRNTFARLRGQILGWGVSLALLAVFLVRFYDSIAAQKDNYIKMMANYPKELLAFFSTSDVMQMFTPSGYLNLEFFSYITIIVGFFAVLGGSSLFSGDEERGIMDLLLGHPVSRAAFFVGRLLAFLLATIAILALTWLGFILAQPGTTLNLTGGELALPLVSLFGILAVFGALAVLLSMVLPSGRMAAMTSGILLVGSYFVNALSKINHDLDTLAKLTPFRYYQGGLAIDGMQWDVVGWMLAFSVLFVLLALWRFQRRDIRVGGEGGWRIPFLPSRKAAVAAKD